LALGSGAIGWRLCGLAGLELGLESFDVAGVLAQLGVGGSLADAGQGPVDGLGTVGRDADADQRVHDFQLERSTGQIVLGPPKSRAGRRVVGIPSVILLDVREHLAVFTGPAPGALVFPGPKGGPLRRGNFNGQANWPQAVAAIGASGLHFHDLRHTGNAWAATSGAGLRDLMARMGHDSERVAIIYQHQARGADRVITRAIDAHADAELGRDGGDGASAGGQAPPG
jgi:hypothetical protein